jgi:4,5-dihydroxyphthalate decarboxylase
VRRSIVEKYPWVVLNLYSAFEEAKARSLQIRDTNLIPYIESGLIDGKAVDTLKTDLLPYGIKRSRHVLETITQSVVEDGLAQRRVALEELFAPNTMEL